MICAVCGKPGLTASATVNGDPVAMTEENGSVSAIVPFKVTNVRAPEMPKTGEQGTWLFAAGGVMLVSLAGRWHPDLHQAPQKAGRREVICV